MTTPIPEQSVVPDAELSALDDFIAATETERWKYRGAKEQHIRRWMWHHTRALADLSRQSAVTVYYQRLNVLLDTPEWIATHPQLAARLRAHREGA